MSQTSPKSYFSKIIEEDRSRKSREEKRKKDEQLKNDQSSGIHSHGDASDLFDFDSRFNKCDANMKKLETEIQTLAKDTEKVQLIMTVCTSKIESNKNNEYSSPERYHRTSLTMKEPDSFYDDVENRAKNEDLSSPLLLSSDALTIESEAVLLNFSYFSFVASVILWFFSMERSIALNRTILLSLAVITYIVLSIGTHHTIRCIKNQSLVDPMLGSILPYFVVPVGYSIKMIKLKVDNQDGDWSYIENLSWISFWSMMGIANLIMVLRYNGERRKNMKTLPVHKMMDLENHDHLTPSF